MTKNSIKKQRLKISSPANKLVKAGDFDWDDNLLKICNKPHYMQSNAWANTKNSSSWHVTQTQLQAANFKYPLQVFSRHVPGFGKLHYVPEITGLEVSKISKFTESIRKEYNKGLAIKIELYQPYDEKLLGSFLSHGWLRANSVQHRHTVIVDLSGSEDVMFSKLKKRARYEIRSAKRNDVSTEKVQINKKNINILFNLIEVTSNRTGAFFRKRDYFEKYWNAFNDKNQGNLYFAKHEGEIIAVAFVITFGEVAWYKDGGSTRTKSNLMGSRALQWEIMCDLQKKGIKHYDLSGIPSEKDKLTSSMKGLYTFKTGFSNETTTFMPALELPIGAKYPIWPKVEHQFLRMYSALTKDFWY